MYQVGDRVVYGSHGVCRVVEEESRVVDRKRVTYLVLEPEGGKGSRYLVPTQNANAMAKLSPLLTKEAITALLSGEAVRQDAWIVDESRRKQRYRELISSGRREEIARMVHTLYRHRDRQAELGRKVHMCDDNFLRDAERLLISEAASVLETTQEEAKAFVRSLLK